MLCLKCYEDHEDIFISINFCLIFGVYIFFRELENNALYNIILNTVPEAGSSP